jgi:hypothetical protein
MSFTGREGSDERLGQAFERALLDSARADEPSAEVTKQAWARFSASMMAVAPGGRAAGAPVAGGAVRGVAVKWLLLGAIGGSVLTGVSMRSSYFKTLVSSRATVSPSAAAVRADEIHQSPPRMPTFVDPPVPAARFGSARSIVARRTAGQDGLPRREGPLAAGPPFSSLAAEVAALDAARTAASANSFDEVLRLIDQYHYDFPLGELSADADVVAIEVLDAKNDRAEAERRAARFLERYPNDPHAARLRRLVH